MSWDEYEPKPAAAPPQGQGAVPAPIDDSRPPQDAAPADGTTWFVVAPAKFVFMSVFTGTLYYLYWFYRQWDHVRTATGSNIKPAARSLFAPIFCDALFVRILDAEEPERRHRLKALVLAIAYILCILLFRLPSLISLMGFMGIAPMLVVVRAANAAALRQNPNVSPNRRLTAANLGAVGATLLLMGAVGWLQFQQDIASGVYLARIAAEQNRGLPKFLDDETQFLSVTGSPGLLVYLYRLPKRTASEINAERVIAARTAPITESACKRARLLLSGGVTLRYLYTDMNDREILHIDVTRRDCHN